jgi:4-hydroxy-tetrahydrodipicolinate reductase
MTEPVKIAVAGALGRMGRTVCDAVEARPDAVLAGRFDRPGAEDDYGCVPAEAALQAAQVVIDFSAPAASAELAGKIAVVKSGNFSLGVNLLAGLVRQAAAKLGGDYDIEVFEAHHRRKVDAPSGTALMLGEAAAEGRGVALGEAEVRARDGQTGPRPAGAIGFSVMRAGGIVGEHSVVFAADDEIITLSHSARDRALFARGAVEAALWAAGRPAGLYGMDDVLGLKGG